MPARYWTHALVLLLVSLLFAYGRLLIEPRLVDIPTFNLTYEALVHIFVGGLIGAAVVAWEAEVLKHLPEDECVRWQRSRYYPQKPLAKLCAVLAAALTLFEVAMFFLQRSNVT